MYISITNNSSLTTAMVLVAIGYAFKQVGEDELTRSFGGDVTTDEGRIVFTGTVPNSGSMKLVVEDSDGPTQVN